VSSEEGKAVVRRYIDEVLNGKQVHLIDELVAENFVAHRNHPSMLPGRAGVHQAVAQNPPDYHATIEDLLADGDKVIARVTETATPTGDVFGIPAAGKRLTGSWIAIYRVREGQIAERWYEADLLGMMRQLGVMPQLGAAAE
jgi:predicted ester cyclase